MKVSMVSMKKPNGSLYTICGYPVFYFEKKGLFGMSTKTAPIGLSTAKNPKSVKIPCDMKFVLYTTELRDFFSTNHLTPCLRARILPDGGSAYYALIVVVDKRWLLESGNVKLARVMVEMSVFGNCENEELFDRFLETLFKEKNIIDSGIKEVIRQYFIRAIAKRMARDELGDHITSCVEYTAEIVAGIAHIENVSCDYVYNVDRRVSYHLAKLDLKHLRKMTN